MKYIRLFLKGYKPLLYGGTKQLELNDMTQIVILSGENGKGKSSVLRELSPYPATRSDYEKNGLKVIEIQHKNDYYVLTSDFSKTGAHSFVRNNEELNISGTTDVQEDLVQQYFEGFTPLVERLTSGQCKFSQLGRPERGKIIMATYPSPMLFILEKYKNLMSKIRACNNQLKLMHERKLKLKESFIDDSKLENYNNLRAIMNEALTALDQDILIMSQYIQPILDMPNYKYDFAYTIEDVLNRCEELREKFNKVTSCMKDVNVDIPDYAPKLQVILQLIDAKIEAAKKEIESYTTRGTDIVEEIERYNTYLKTDREQVIKECESMIETQKSIIKEFTIEDDTPIVDIEEAEQMRECSSKIQEHLQFLRSLNVELWSEDEFITKERELKSLEADMRTTSIQISRLDSDLQKMHYRLNRYTTHPAAEGCVLRCRLRESMDQIIESIKIEIETTTASKKKLVDEFNSFKIVSDKLKNDLEVRSPARPIIDRFERLTHNKTWGDFICSNGSFISAANSNISEIWNRYIRIIKKSEASDKVRKAKDMLVILETKLTGLKTDHQPAKKVISETLIKREAELKKITEKKTELSLKLGSEIQQKEFYTVYYELYESIETLEERWSKLREHLELKAIVSFVQDEISRMKETKIQISERLREFDTIAREQENLRTRLNDEIEPIIKELNEQLRKWKAVEKVLSPTKGIPNERIVKYINAIFLRANAFIKQVWNYDMELEYLKENEECDYTFKVIINGDGIVKDINTCSKGQKEIIDLAIILAICKYRKYSTVFPIKLDEMSSGLSPEHSTKLFEYLGELFHQSNILQAFIVNHDPVITSSYTDASYAVLSEDYPMPASCRVITKINE